MHTQITCVVLFKTSHFLARNTPTGNIVSLQNIRAYRLLAQVNPGLRVGLTISASDIIPLQPVL